MGGWASQRATPAAAAIKKSIDHGISSSKAYKRCGRVSSQDGEPARHPITLEDAGNVNPKLLVVNSGDTW